MHDPRPILEQLDHNRPLVMGILNATPDSFSDGGTWGTVDRAVAHAEQMLTNGADIIDVGGESSRPGAESVDLDTEVERVIPVIERLAGRCVLSVDTAKPEVAEAAIASGAHIVNDITASLETVAAAGNAGWVAMHMQGEPRTMQKTPTYDNVVREVTDSLRQATERGRAAGVEHLWLDPGIGFGKSTTHNLELLQSIRKLAMVDEKLVVGVSRKRLVGELHAASDRAQNVAGLADRLEGSIVAAVWSWYHSAHIVRVHDVRASVLAAKHCQDMAASGQDGY